MKNQKVWPEETSDWLSSSEIILNYETDLIRGKWSRLLNWSIYILGQIKGIIPADEG